MGYLIELIILLALFGLLLLIMAMHRKNAPRWHPGAARPPGAPGGASGCCLDVPCSKQCADRLSALILISTTDGVNLATRQQAEIRQLLAGPAQDDARPAAGTPAA